MYMESVNKNLNSVPISVLLSLLFCTISVPPLGVLHPPSSRHISGPKVNSLLHTSIKENINSEAYMHYIDAGTAQYITNF